MKKAKAILGAAMLLAGATKVDAAILYQFSSLSSYRVTSDGAGLFGGNVPSTEGAFGLTTNIWLNNDGTLNHFENFSDSYGSIIGSFLALSTPTYFSLTGTDPTFEFRLDGTAGAGTTTTSLSISLDRAFLSGGQVYSPPPLNQPYLTATPITIPSSMSGYGKNGGFSVTNALGTTNFELKLSDLKVASLPEPATWAFMLLGFGLIGTAFRASRRLAAA